VLENGLRSPQSVMAKRCSGDGVRLCGTPGCTLPDFHAGPCSNAASLGRRREHNIKLPYNEKAAQQLLRGEAAAIKASKREQRERKKQQRPVAAERPVSPPPPQQRLPSGLARFYHPLEWGVPLREGPVEADPVPPSWRHEAGAWQLEQAADRIRSRRGVGEAEAAFMDLWNGAVQRSERSRLVSDRCLPALCRAFAVQHAAELRGLAAPFRSHLEVLRQHNLLHPEDVRDCLVLSSPDAAASPCARCSRPRHERHCPLHGVRRGAACWPTANGAGGTSTVSAADVLTIVGKECEVCGSPRDAERMLLCDGCNKGFHLGCLSPPLAAIPESDWYCAACTVTVHGVVDKAQRLSGSGY